MSKQRGYYRRDYHPENDPGYALLILLIAGLALIIVMALDRFL